MKIPSSKSFPRWKGCFFTTMRRLPFLILYLLLGLAMGCDHQHTFNRVLVEADSLVEQQADSALHLLENIPDVMNKGDESNRAYYTLLLMQAKYKCYESAPSDSLINAAVHYYEQTGNASLLCRAYYYRAMTFYEQGRHEEALLLLKKGEDLAIHNHDTLYMAKYHESLIKVNDDIKYYDMMLKYAKLFMSDAIHLKDTAVIARSYSHVSTAYYRVGLWKEAQNYLQRTMSLLHNTNPVTKSYILTNIGCYIHMKGDMETARYYLEESLKANPMPHTYAELGNVYADEGNIQEAEKNWQEALKTDDSQTLLNVLSSMQERYEQQHDYQSAISISNRIHQIKDSLTQASEQAALAEIQHKYDKQVVENKYYKVLVWLFGSLLLLIAISICYYYYHRRTVRRYTNQLTAKEEAIRNAQQRIALLEGMDGEHHEEIMALDAQIQMIRQQTHEQLGQGKEVYEAIAAGKKLQSTNKEHYLIEYYSILRYEQYASWMNEYKDLTSRLLTYLILQDMGKSDSEIQDTLSITNSSLRSIKTRLKAHLRHP